MFRIRNQATKNFLFFILTIGFIGLMVWGNLNFVKQNPGGNDFLVNWIGTQSLVKENLNPYSDTVANRIEKQAYGRPAVVGEELELRVSYPLYSAFLFLPFSLINDFELARAIWMTVLEVALFFTVLLGLRISNWQPSLLMIVLLMVFSLFWYHGLRPLIAGNAIILIAFCAVFVLFLINQKQDELAGIILALMTIQLQVVVIFIVLILFWSFINRRWRVVFWFFSSIILLIVLSLFFKPTWMIQFLQELVRQPSLVLPSTPAQALELLLPGIGYRMGLLISALSAFILVLEAFLARKARGTSLVWVASLTLVLGQWINIKTDPIYFLVMLPALFLSLKMIQERWPSFGLWINLGLLLILFVLPWWIFTDLTLYGRQVVESPLLFFVSPAIFIILLYWVRWWTKNPIKHTLDN